jgi:Resolvase, N terminal domain
VGKEIRKAVAYLRTSSRTNVGADKDSDKRQRAAIEAYAKTADYEIAEEFYDAAVSGADPVSERSGFAEMLERLMSNGAKTIIVESPDRFARDLMVQLAGHDMLRARGITLIAASAPMHFVEDTPTAVWSVRSSAPSPSSRRPPSSPNWRPPAGASASRPARRSRGARATSRRALTLWR